MGESGKMSASDPDSAIYVTDTAKEIIKKINKSYTGGRDSETEQQNYGAKLEDIPFKYLSFFLEDDSELEYIRKEYGEGNMPTGVHHMQSGSVKEQLAQVLIDIVERHRRARAVVTDEMVDAFMAVRPLPNMFE